MLRQAVNQHLAFLGMCIWQAGRRECTCMYGVSSSMVQPVRQDWLVQA